MIKSIALLRRKPDVSREAFIDYYETRHAPLILSLFPTIREYRRNFIDLEGAFLYPDARPVDFDAVTEIWFDDRAGYDAFVAHATKPEIAQKIADDESNFLVSSMTRMFLVEEHRSAITGQG